jgi:hypothetical protein
LPYVFSWEYKTIAVGFLEWDGIVAVVHLGKSKFFEVSNKSSQNLSLWHRKCRIFVIFYRKRKVKMFRNDLLARSSIKFIARYSFPMLSTRFGLAW